MTLTDDELDRRLRAGLAAVVAEVEAGPPSLPGPRPAVPRRGPVGAVVAAVAVALVLGGIGLALRGGDETDDPPAAAPRSEPTTVTTAAAPGGVPGYDLPRDPASAAGFPGNSLVVVGTVVDVSEPFAPGRPVGVPAGQDDAPSGLVSRRVTVEVTSVLRGGAAEGAPIELRIIDGGGDGAPEGWRAGLTRGAVIAVFGGDRVAYEDGTTMLTPNHLLFGTDDRFGPLAPATPSDPDAVSLAQLRDLVDGAPAFGG